MVALLILLLLLRFVLVGQLQSAVSLDCYTGGAFRGSFLARCRDKNSLPSCPCEGSRDARQGNQSPGEGGSQGATRVLCLCLS